MLIVQVLSHYCKSLVAILEELLVSYWLAFVLIHILFISSLPSHLFLWLFAYYYSIRMVSRKLSDLSSQNNRCINNLFLKYSLSQITLQSYLRDFYSQYYYNLKQAIVKMLDKACTYRD